MTLSIRILAFYTTYAVPLLETSRSKIQHLRVIDRVFESGPLKIRSANFQLRKLNKYDDIYIHHEKARYVVP